jgi:serine protein kinase
MESVTEGKMNQLKRITSLFDRNKFRSLNSEMSMAEYIDLCLKQPKLGRNSWQMIYDMIMEKGYSTFEEYRKTYTHYNFFDDEEIPIVGLSEMKDSLVKFIKGAAGHYGTEKRVLLLHGPVGSAKSTTCRLLKRGLERYSHTDSGAWYTFKWVGLPTGQDGIYTSDECESPLHENPLKLLPNELRQQVLAEMNAAMIEQTPEEKRAELYTSSATAI